MSDYIIGRIEFAPITIMEAERQGPLVMVEKTLDLAELKSLWPSDDHSVTSELLIRAEALTVERDALRGLLKRMRPLLHAQWKAEIDAALKASEEATGDSLARSGPGAKA